ncbi:MAG: hypothetical protein WDN26_21230 [Chitinophagaceae bacterium]
MLPPVRINHSPILIWLPQPINTAVTLNTLANDKTGNNTSVTLNPASVSVTRRAAAWYLLL